MPTPLLKALESPTWYRNQAQKVAGWCSLNSPKKSLDLEHSEDQRQGPFLPPLSFTHTPQTWVMTGQ